MDSPSPTIKVANRRQIKCNANSDTKQSNWKIEQCIWHSLREGNLVWAFFVRPFILMFTLGNCCVHLRRNNFGGGLKSIRMMSTARTIHECFKCDSICKALHRKQWRSEKKRNQSHRWLGFGFVAFQFHFGDVFQINQYTLNI